MNCSAPELHFSTRFLEGWPQKRRIASGPILVPGADNQISEVRRSYSSCGPVAQWITRLPTEQKIPGSNPGWFGIFHYPKEDLNLTPNLTDRLPLTLSIDW